MTTAARRRTRRHSHLAVVLLPCAALGGWAHLHEPWHAAGLGLMLAPAMIAGVLLPGLVTSAEALPQLLVPPRLRIWWRRGRDHRPHIPARLRHAVYAADRWRCCWCGGAEGLQLDHVRPWSRGGLTVLWNLMTLCGDCNKRKSNYWVTRDGYEYYRPFEGASDITFAAEVLAFEKVERWSPGRWIRAGWSLGA